MKQADIVVTNPPFSLFREFVQLCLDYDRQFLVIGSLGAISYENVVELLTLDKIRIGYNKVDRFVNNGRLKRIRAYWYTTLQVRDKAPLQLSCKYKASEYPKYDNYDAIEVSNLKSIPVDYKGAMGVPITFLTVWCRKQFDVLDVTRTKTKVLRTRVYSKKESIASHHALGYRNTSDLNSRACLLKDGIPRAIFARVLIKWK